jgi:anti-sigma regulatory factor (Ser/Thr protein kinase)
MYLQRQVRIQHDGPVARPYQLSEETLRSFVMTSHQVGWASDTVSEDASLDGPPPAARHGAAPRNGADPSDFAASGLDHGPHAPAAARDFVRATLGAWGVGELVDDVAVVASELVTNALRYGLAGSQPTLSRQPVLLGLLRQGRTVLCAVFDPGTEVPVVKEPDYFSESGRGLHVMESLSDAWGWTPPDLSGKAVWATFSAPAPEAAVSRPGSAPPFRPFGRVVPERPLPDRSGVGWDPLTRLLGLVRLLPAPRG